MGTDQNIEDILPKISRDAYDITSHQYHLAILVTANYLYQLRVEKKSFHLEELNERLKPFTHLEKIVKEDSSRSLLNNRRL
jgi:hypothetical protein